MFKKLIFCAVLTSTAALAQERQANGGDPRAAERAQIEKSATEFLKYVSTQIDAMNPDQYASSFRCPINETSDLGVVYTREVVKSKIAGILIKASEYTHHDADGVGRSFIMQKGLRWDTNGEGELLLLQREPYLSKHAGERHELLAFFILQAVCRDANSDRLTANHSQYLMSILRSVAQQQ